MRHARFASLFVVAVVLVGACSPAAQAGFVYETQVPISSDAGAGAGNVGGTASQGAAASASVIPVIISSQLAVGDNRLVYSFLDPKTQLPVGSPDLQSSVSFIAPGTTNPTTAVPGEFIWAIQGSRGEYITHATFPAAGDWKAIFTVQPKDGQAQAIGIPFSVLLKPTVVSVGDHAPNTRTPTLSDVGGDIRQISSDTNPDPAFYQVSVDQALARKTPFILVFATPAFCRSAQCGPTLDVVKKARQTAPSSVAFINVEPYTLKYTDGRVQPVLDAQGNLQPTDVSNAWGLPTEPWIFAVDRNGIVQGSFEGIVSQQELQDVIAKIAAS
ncbi:MAG TPA: hypothetical protein VIH37_13750 [Candidatus Limnocylindrales bacterium]